MSEQEILAEIKKLDKFVKECTPAQARQILVKAGIINQDGSFTDRYK